MSSFVFQQKQYLLAFFSHPIVVKSAKKAKKVVKCVEGAKNTKDRRSAAWFLQKEDFKIYTEFYQIPIRGYMDTFMWVHGYVYVM